MAVVTRLETRRELVQRDVAKGIEAQLALYPAEALPAQPRAAILNALHRVTRPDDKEGLWPGGFTMLSRNETAAIWDAIRALPSDDRPNQVRHAFDLVLLNLRQDTGEVMLTRDEFAERIGCAPTNVSHIMGTLERMGVIRRERRRVEGVRGRGMVVYYVNAHVAWNGSLAARKEAARKVEQPSLQLVRTPAE